MRILVWCNFHCDSDLGKCSAVNLTYDLCNWMYKNVSGFHAYYFGPKNGSKLKLPDRFFNHDGITVLPYGPSKFYKFRSHMSDDALDLVHPERTKYAYDMILTRDTFTTAWWRFALLRRNGAWFKSVDIPIACMVQESIDESGIPQCLDISGRVMELAAFLTSNKLLVASQCESNLLLDLCHNYLSASMALKVRDKIQIIPNPVDYSVVRSREKEYLEARNNRRALRKSWVIFHGGTFEGKRQLPKVCRGIDNLPVRERKNFKFLMSSQTTGNLKCQHVEVELKNHQNREQYYDNLKLGDICIWPSTRQTAGIGYNEAAMAGMIPIVFNAPWVLERIPSGYPYIMKNIEQDLPLLLLHIVRNYEEACDWAAKLRESISPWGVDKVGVKYVKVFEELIIKNRKKCAKELIKSVGGGIVEKAIEKMPDNFIGFDDLRDLCKEISSDLGVVASNFSNLALRWMILSYGFEDIGGSIPKFKRVES